MHRFRTAAAAALTLAVAACSDAPAGPDAALTPLPTAQNLEAVVPGEVIVKMKEGFEASALVGTTPGLSFNRTGYKSEFSVLSVSRGNERAEAARLSADPRVEYAEPNYLRQPSAIDPRLWAFYNPGGLNAYFNDPADTRHGQPLGATYASLSDADEDAIAGIGAGGAAVIIGSLDTGVDMDHPEFTGRLIAGRDWVSADNNPEDDNGHGTHTSGTMAGTTVGVAGVTGAAANVRIHVQRVCGPSGCPTTAIVNAIRAAADVPGMVAMNLSLGGSTISKAEKDAINYAVNTKGVLVIAAAGNSGTSKVGCPACDANAISVSATSWRDALAYYSQYGSGLDISAPGGEMYSNTTDEMGIYSSYLNGGYAFLQGTSMATPQVTGAAAVVASKTGLRGAALRNRLLSTADDKGTAGVDTKFGNGRLNVYRAVTGTSLGAGL
ncbi:S8 family serine peptidase [Longimicrobium sp.]|uniref:S8 family serine peptidase n=1 Tax=Longimicrobium sp. TaxID=2029185 RepID=UPI003B3AFCCD